MGGLLEEDEKLEEDLEQEDLIDEEMWKDFEKRKVDVRREIYELDMKQTIEGFWDTCAYWEEKEAWNKIKDDPNRVKKYYY